ncbi:MAG: MMCAP2_0566 family conjugal transfer protein, partial [Clostridia bacterium]
MGKLLSIIDTSTLSILSDLGDGIMEIVMSILGPILWGLCDIFFIILDLFEKVFRALAGTLEGGVKIQGTRVEGDIVLYLIQSRLVTEIFISILILSFVLLIIFTIFAIVKNIYIDKPKPIMNIINSSVKALLMYLLVPIATVVCLLVGNVVLQAIDGATHTRGATSVSDVLFMSASYNANELRDDDLSDCRDTLIEGWDSDYSAITAEITERTGITKETVGTATRDQLNTIAEIVDQNFIAGNLTWTDKWGVVGVMKYYSYARMSYITIWVGGTFLIIALANIARGLVVRMFKMVFYFAISPAIMATFPIDDGKALGSWRGEMVKNGTMAFVSTAVINILYSLLPVFNGIDVGGVGIGGMIIKLFIIAVLFNGAKEIISNISSWFAVGEAMGVGESNKGAIKKALTASAQPYKNASLKGIGAYAGAKGAIDKAKEQGKNAAWAGMVGAFSGSGLRDTLGGKTMDEFRKTMGDKEKSGAEQYKNQQTRRAFGFGGTDKDKVTAWESVESRNKLKKQYTAMTGSDNQVYDVDADDGDNADMIQYRQWLNSRSNAGKAVLESQLLKLESDKKKNSKEAEYVELLSSRAKAKKKQLTTLGDLHNMGIDTSAWNLSDLAAVKMQLNSEMQTRASRGENVDMLKDIASSLIEATESVGSAEKSIKQKRKIDTSFESYVTNEGRDVYNNAMSGRSDDLKELDKAREEIDKMKITLEKREEQYEKVMAKINEEEIFGKIGKEDPKRKIIDNYNKS